MIRLCLVVELYSGWCGPCKSVIPTFKKIRLEKDDTSTLQFLSVNYLNLNLKLIEFRCVVKNVTFWKRQKRGLEIQNPFFYYLEMAF